MDRARPGPVVIWSKRSFHKGHSAPSSNNFQKSLRHSCMSPFHVQQFQDWLHPPLVDRVLWRRISSWRQRRKPLVVQNMSPFWRLSLKLQGKPSCLRIQKRTGNTVEGVVLYHDRRKFQFRPMAGTIPNCGSERAWKLLELFGHHPAHCLAALRDHCGSVRSFSQESRS